MKGWKCTPQHARWYGCVVFEGEDGETQYNDGYSSARDEPDASAMAPKGAVVLETEVRATPRNPAYAITEEWG